MDITTFKSVFDRYAGDWIEKKLSEYPDLVIDEQVLSYIQQSGELIRSGGKRFRPYLCALMYQSCGGKKIQDILPAGLAIELFHTFALIHDDIIDRGQIRHGVATMHVAVLEKLKRNHSIGDIVHVAQGQAMLVGDLVHLWVFEVFHKLSFSEEQKANAFDYLTRMINEVIVGEMIDVDITTRRSVSDVLLYQKTLLKTATYSFVRPMQIGAVLAGAGNDIRLFSEKFGQALGMAFQIQDDLFDLTLSAGVVHKSVLSDIAEGQHTYFTQYIFTKGTEEEKQKLLSYFGRPVHQEQSTDILSLFESSGAIFYGTEKMNGYFDEAKMILEQSGIDMELKERLRSLVVHIRGRTN